VDDNDVTGTLALERGSSDAVDRDASRTQEFEPEERRDAASSGDITPDVAVVRDLILNAYSDLVPELVRGDTIKEVIASVDLARRAFGAVASRVATESRVPRVPAGAPSRAQPTSMSDLSPAAKISEGLRQQKIRIGNGGASGA
jgi:hypothetical protein